MRIPRKIQIVDSLRSSDSMLRFDHWEGYDTKKQILNLALKVNTILEYLEALPQIPNETPQKTELEGTTLIHAHDWVEHAKIGPRGFYECRDCGEKMEKLITQ